MNIEEIKELAQLLKQNDLSALEVVEGDSRIRLERSVTAVTEVRPARVIDPVESVAPVKEDSGIDFNRLKQVKAPLVGVFYAASSPDAEPFVKIGSTVKKGDVLCIVEAMKLMNEITSDIEGEIVDICANNGDVVEYGQTLFKLS